jgi:beta-N-acetylhexosaminidase
MKYSLLLLICISLLFVSCTGGKTTIMGPRSTAPVRTKADVDKLFNTRYDRIESMIARMSLEEKVAQMLAPRAFSHYISEDTDIYRELMRQVTELKVGGLVFFAGDVAEMALIANEAQKNAEIPLLISADFEWGAGMRVRRSTTFPAAMGLGATRDRELVYRIGEAVAREGRALGVHQNFAPVTEPNVNPNNPVINYRSFGENRELVSELASAYTHGTQDGGLIATAKHFPGHGATDIDSHISMPHLPYTRDELDEKELVTFRNVIDSGVLSIMTAHIAFPNIAEDENRPATLSRRLITDILRGDLGFSGLVVTDALEMRAISRNFRPGEAAVLAVEAGVDMLLIPPAIDEALQSIIAAVRTGRISEETIDNAVRRILITKHWAGLFQNRHIEIGAIRSAVAVESHRNLALEAARKAITLVRNFNDIIPIQIDRQPRVVIITIADQVEQRMNVSRPRFSAPNETVGHYFVQLVRSHLGGADIIRLDPRSNSIEFESALKKATEADIVIGAAYVQARSSQGMIGLPDSMMQALEKIVELENPFVLISFGDPYFAGSLPGADAILCAYFPAEAMIEAMTETIFGLNPPTGKLPVTISGIAEYGTGLTYTGITNDISPPAPEEDEHPGIENID